MLREKVAQGRYYGLLLLTDLKCSCTLYYAKRESRGRSPNFKSVLKHSPMLDTHFFNLRQMAHKLWLLHLFYPIYDFWGERVAKK